MIVNLSDVVVTGSAPEHFIRKRIWSNKLTFRYSERPLKHGLEIKKYLPRLIRWRFRNPACLKMYLLAASAYASYDYARFAMFRGKAYKWGYFTDLREYDDIDDLLDRKDTNEILWCGRFLEWKHPEHVLFAFQKLREAGYSCTLRFIGSGPLEEKLRSLVSDMGLSEYVCICASMPPAAVRDQMEHAGIYVVSSDFEEGWGAVVNEAMNSACAVVSSHSVGAAPFLIEDGKNGVIYRFGDADGLYRRLAELLSDPARQRSYGKAAYQTIAGEWNARVACERFLRLCRAILDGDKRPELFSSGPCSRAEIIKDDWYTGDTRNVCTE